MGRVLLRTVVGAAAAVALAGGLLPPSAPAVPGVAARAAQAAVVPAATWSPIPSYTAAKVDHPAIYSNGCHAGVDVLTPKPCTVLNASSSRTVMLFGDSHAASWYGAVLGSADLHGWRVRTLTKSGCSPLAMPIARYKRTIPYEQCATWRWRALKGLEAGSFGRIDVLVISSWHLHAVLRSWTTTERLTGTEKVARWEQALATTVRMALGSAKQVVVLRDSPQLPFDKYEAQECFAAWGSEAGTRCGAPVRSALSSVIWRAERDAVAAAASPDRARAVDLTTMQCPDSWCGPLWGRYLMFKDDNHWTQTYVRVRLTAPLDAVLVPAMTRANP